MPAANTNTAHSTDLRARFAAAKTAVLAPHADVIARLCAEGAVVEAQAYIGGGEVPAESVVKVWIFDQAGRLHISAKLSSSYGRALRGPFCNHSVGRADKSESCTADDLVGAARAARLTRVN